MRAERIRARQLRARLTATLLSNLITQWQCIFNSSHVRSIINLIMIHSLKFLNCLPSLSSNKKVKTEEGEKIRSKTPVLGTKFTSKLKTQTKLLQITQTKLLQIAFAFDHAHLKGKGYSHRSAGSPCS